LNRGKTAVDWDGGVSTIRNTTQIQLKSVDPNAIYYRDSTRKLARLASEYGDDQMLLVTREAADDVVSRTANPGRVGSSGVSNAEAQAVAEIARDAAEGSSLARWRLSNRMAMSAARKAGLIGGVITGGLSAYQNVRDYREGRINIETAVAGTTVDAVGGIASAAAGAWAGAMAGAAIGTVVPGVGNIVGAVVGFGVGFAVGFGVQAAWDKFVKEPATRFLANGLGAYRGIAANARTIANVATQRIQSAVSTTARRITTTVSNTARRVTTAVTNTARRVTTAVSNTVDKVQDAVSNAAESVTSFVSNLFGG
jgi:hypothetical protein